MDDPCRGAEGAAGPYPNPASVPGVQPEPPPQPVTEEELVQRLIDGDKTAVDQLMLRYYDRLLNYIRQQMPTNLTSRVGPEDILQQSYMKAFRALEGFEPQNSSSFFSWLKRIADNERKDQLRKVGREPNQQSRAPKADESSYMDLVDQVVDDGQGRASVIVRQKELVSVLRVKLAGMKEEYREAVELYYLQGRPLEEVAQSMKLTTGQVRGILHRAKGSLRGAIASLSHFV